MNFGRYGRSFYNMVTHPFPIVSKTSPGGNISALQILSTTHLHIFHAITVSGDTHKHEYHIDLIYTMEPFSSALIWLPIDVHLKVQIRF